MLPQPLAEEEEEEAPPGTSTAPLGTNCVKNRKKLSQAGTVLPVSELIIHRNTAQTPFAQGIWKL